MLPPPWAPVLTDGRIVLRAHRPEDVPDLVDQCRDEATQRWTTVPVPYTTAHAADFVASRRAQWESGRHLSLAVEAGGRFLGTLDLRPTRDGAAEVSYILMPQARGRGTGEAALRLLLPWAFEALDLQVIHWQAAVGNWPSRRLAWRLGFGIESRVSGLISQRGRLLDGWIGSLRRGRPLRPDRDWYRPPAITGGPVMVRPVDGHDAESMAEACSDVETQYWLPLLPAPYTLADARDHLLGIAEDQAGGRALYWAVTAAGGDGRMLGEIGLQVRRHEAEVGYWTHPVGRRRGLTTAAVRLVARHALLPEADGGLGLSRVMLRAAEGNLGSQSIARRVGFRHTGTDRDGELLRDGTVLDMLRFDLLAEECP